jgi:hypothetical protein
VQNSDVLKVCASRIVSPVQKTPVPIGRGAPLYNVKARSIEPGICGLEGRDGAKQLKKAVSVVILKVPFDRLPHE